MNIQSIFDKVKPLFDTLKGEENIEVEMRLGKHNGSLFDTNVGKDAWEKVLKGLRKYKGWESTKSTVADVYYNDANSIRITTDEDSGEQTMVQKINVVKEDFKCEPSTFVLVFPGNPKFRTIRDGSEAYKDTPLICTQNVSIDMTISSGDNVDMDSEDEASYQIELEISNPQDVKNDNEFTISSTRSQTSLKFSKLIIKMSVQPMASAMNLTAPTPTFMNKVRAGNRPTLMKVGAVVAVLIAIVLYMRRSGSKEKKEKYLMKKMRKMMR